MTTPTTEQTKAIRDYLKGRHIPRGLGTAREARGPIPEGLHVLHSCDNPPCINPVHLFLGTDADNVADMDRKGRRVVSVYRGEQHPNARFSDAIVRVIRSRWEAGESQSVIARDMGMNRVTVQGIAVRRTWRHV